MPNQTRMIVGMIVWLGLLGWAGFKVVGRFTDSDDSAARELVRFAFQSRNNYELVFDDSHVVRIGDPVFWRNGAGELTQVGVIRQVDSPESVNYAATRTDWASVTFFASAPEITSDSYLELFETPSSMGWVAEALLPPEKRAELARYIGHIFSENSDVLVEQLKPVFLEAVAATGQVVREELGLAIADHGQRWQELGHRFQSEIVENELIPLVNTEVWPVIEEEMTPVIEKIGEEVWLRASIWRFGWRAVYDSLPLPGQNLTQAEFSRFVQSSALPVVRARLPELIAAQQRVMTRVVDNPHIRKFIADTFVKVGNDVELQNLIVEIVQEAVLENRNFHRQLDEIWNQPHVQQALRFSDAASFGPYVETIGEKLFGSPVKGVTPEFARVLRHRVFLKDMRWLVLTDTRNEPSMRIDAMDVRRPNTLPLIKSTRSTGDNPFFIEARDRK